MHRFLCYLIILRLHHVFLCHKSVDHILKVKHEMPFISSQVTVRVLSTRGIRLNQTFIKRCIYYNVELTNNIMEDVIIEENSCQLLSC